MRGQKTDVRFSDVNWGAIKSLLPYLLEYKLRIILAIICLVGAKLASVYLPFTLKHIVDSLDTNLAILPIGMLLAYGCARFSAVLFGELRDVLFGRVTERAMRRIGLKAFEHLHNLDLEFHLNRRTGGLSRDIERGTNGISFILRFMVFNIVPTLFELGLVVVVLFVNYRPLFAFIVLSTVLLYIIFSVFTTEWRTRYIRAANTAESASSTRAVDSLLNYETVKYFTNEAYESAEYDKGLVAWEKAKRQNRLSLFFLNGGQALIIATAMTLAMSLAAVDVSRGAMTIGDFVLINAFMMQIFIPLNFLGFVYREMKGSMTNVEKLFALLKEVPKVSDVANATTLAVGRGEVVFDQVGFYYEPDRKILNNVSFSVPAKSKIALVGGSGAGKSTLFKLLFRFYEVSSGTITIDGQDIRLVSQQSLRGAIGVIPQDTVLFNTSIRENVRYGYINASDEEVLAAVRLAHLGDFIEQLPEGLDTPVGERGLKLSGGEKQRVAIARAILKRPPIMVFDEATSSLDSHSEQEILQAIKAISREQTTLVIAHRLSTIVDADCIFVLDKGAVVEQGTHTDLISRNGQYAHLWEIQQNDREAQR